MTRTIRWRHLAIVVGLCVTLGVAEASAQTVIVTDAPPDSTIELLVNSDRVATGTAGADGVATLTFSRPATGPAETTARVIVDSCGNLRRVILVDSGVQPPGIAGACDRQELPSLFVVRPVTTFVVNVGGAASVFIRQGPAPSSWTGGAESAAKVWQPAPRGLMLSGAVGGARFSDAVSVACGDVTSCSGATMRLATSLGAAYWLTPFFAAGVDFIRPADVDAVGHGTNYTFSSLLQTRIVAMTARAGGQAGPVRLYALGGATYQTAISSTTQTVDPTGTSGGGAETFGFKTTGWGWMAGGGLEGWVLSRLGVYAEGARIALRGSATAGEGTLDDQVFLIVAGIRVRVTP